MGKLTQADWELAVVENARRVAFVDRSRAQVTITPSPIYSVELRGGCAVFRVSSFRTAAALNSLLCRRSCNARGQVVGLG